MDWATKKGKATANCPSTVKARFSHWSPPQFSFFWPLDSVAHRGFNSGLAEGLEPLLQQSGSLLPLYRSSVNLHQGDCCCGERSQNGL